MLVKNSLIVKWTKREEFPKRMRNVQIVQSVAENVPIANVVEESAVRSVIGTIGHTRITHRVKTETSFVTNATANVIQRTARLGTRH
jgi:hypothetical protein